MAQFTLYKKGDNTKNCRLHYLNKNQEMKLSAEQVLFVFTEINFVVQEFLCCQ